MELETANRAEPGRPVVLRSFASRVPAQVVDHELFSRLCQTRDYLAAHFSERITLPRAAAEAFFSPFHFQRVFSRAFGESPHDFVSRLRMERAKHLLRKGEMSVSEVCVEVGFESLGTFSKRFAEICGYPPTEFRRVFAAPDIWFLRIVPCCMASMWTRGWPDARE